ncbi:DUF4097 family beta strand repeat-containing protein [Micromonospora sp. NPDC049559]|uniref:DUF4097 family beta strand repeat-containing protein n=1 Tax=Micromonospora sp. NPDC049559 TaxID=3155923 RepID=UPI00341B856B
MLAKQILVTAGALGLLTLTGCGAAFSERRLDYSDTEPVKITEISVAPGAGDVLVRTDAVSSVEIKRVVRYRGAEPRQTGYRIEGTKLSIDTDCGPRCSLSYEIVAPSGVAVRGENGSGDVRISGAGEVDIRVGSGDVEVRETSGSVRAETGSGDITLSDDRGAVTARADSGNVSGQGLGGGAVKAETGSGDIALTLSSAASVSARAGSGDVAVAVPAGSYRVQGASESGSRAIEIANDPNGSLLLDVRTGSGDVSVRPA